ncbi:MAG: 4a-hydroxytetrahydrobiopterin dehydratase [Patescibacteria group bacterium]|jgi:4a-hydroxytetrahydrobiopterin dehydratase
MPVPFRALNVVKQICLGISILYFYSLAIVLELGLPTYGLDRPIVFALVGILFFSAVILEAGVAWWHRRRRIFGALIVIGCYVALGFIVAPALYGSDILWIPLLAPIGIIFVGGFVYAYGTLFYGAIFSGMKLSTDTILAALRGLPGWEYASNGLEKTFRFGSYPEAVEFMNRTIVVSRTHHREPDLVLNRRALKVRISTPDFGVTQADLDLAKDVNAI